MPSDADLMRISIEDLKNSSTSEEDRQRALNELLTLVEPIDNANGMLYSHFETLFKLAFPSVFTNFQRRAIFFCYYFYGKKSIVI